MKIRFFPQEIASQIVLLLLASAVIFHLCISAAFFFGHGNPPPDRSASDNRFILHIADFIKMADAQSGAQREIMLAWLAAADPGLDFKKETFSGALSPVISTDKLVEAVQTDVGPKIEVGHLAQDRQPQRLAFRFEDGTGFSMRIPQSHPGGGPNHTGPALDGFPSEMRPPPPSPAIPLVFGTLLFIAISLTIFLLWAVRAVMRPLRKFATAVNDFTVDGKVTLLEENGPSELRGAAYALNRMRERVKAMVDQRTQMLAAISHDLRTPITRLRLRAEFIDSNDVRDSILRDIEQMNAMVHSALSFIRDGVEVQRNTLLDLSALLQTVCDEFVDLGHRVVYEASGALSIKGNEEELYRAVTNLVSNAVRFGTDVEVSARQIEGAVEIDVSDNGPGIPADQKAAMLAPFMRGDAARPVEGLQGFGLGLPIVQTIVTAHRGSLDLVDREPHGLIARVTLPRK